MTTQVLASRRAGTISEDAEQTWVPKSQGAQAVELSEEWTGLMKSAFAARMRRPPFTFEPHSSNGDDEDPIPLNATSIQREDTRNRLRTSLATIGDLRSSASQADWLEAATALKHDVARLRNTHLARHTSVLLAIADALTFTAPSDPSLDAGAMTMINRALQLLSEPFIAEPAEEAFLINLLSMGWNLAPEFDPESATD